MKAKKSLGQNFLSDPAILKKIADFARITEEDTVVEIGPGEGSLTKLLLERAKKVIAVEKDEKLARRLKARLNDEVGQEAKIERLKIIQGDILEVPSKMPIEGKYILVGNIPYYITGEIFRKFLEAENQPSSLTFVIQKEVADRIMARDKKESILSLSVKAYGVPEYGGIIKAGSFSPSPKVDSAIISVRDINKNKFKELTPSIPLTLRGKEELFFDYVKRGFAHKRKLLKKNLDISEDILEQIGLRKDIRAEDITLSEWFAIIAACQARK